MKKVMKRMNLIALLLMACVATKAQEARQVTVEFGESFTLTEVEGVTTATLTGGSIVVKGQKANEKEATSTDVTITVTPADEFFITRNDIKVYLTVPASTRTMEFDNPLVLTGDDPKDKKVARDYTFTVPDGFGAIIYEANFQSADALYIISGDTKAGVVRWSLNDTKDVMTISGKGSTKDFALGEADFFDPFEVFRAEGSTVKSIVIEAGVTTLGANIFKDFVGLEKISIKENSALLVLGKEAITSKDVTIEVPGNLFNEYQITDGWSDLKIAYAEGSVEMKGIAFNANNTYRAFAYTDKPLMIPSVLKAWVISGLNKSGSALELEEVTDHVIPAKVPVLLTAANKVNEGFRTSVSETEGKAAGKYLKVAPADGLKVEAGQVYVLFNDRFYFSQAGHLSGGKVYLDLRQEAKARTRSSIGINGDGTTAISQIETEAKPIDHTGWYTLDGRKLQSEPTRKGVYINNGKKVVIK